MARQPIRVMGGAQVVPIVNPVAWQKKPFAYRGYPSTGRNPTAPQLAAQIQLAEEATKHYGKRGKIGGLPVVAAKVKAALGGKTTGGKSKADRAKEQHAMASSSIASMKARLNQM